MYIYYKNPLKYITSANTADVQRKLKPVSSSNVYGFYLDVKRAGDNKGTLYVQFKNKYGGPGDVYCYYNVPIRVYRRWITYPSKGHYFWVYIRHIFNYSKLTGNKRGVLPNAIN